jgi:hypothetical protein
MEYAKRLYYYKYIVKRSIRESKFVDPNGFKSLRNKGLDKYYGLVILALTLLLFVEYFIPPGKNTVIVLGFEIQSFGFRDVNTFMWYISQKIFLSVSVIIWFINSNNWWRWAILSPIFFFSYQFWESFQNTLFLESYGNLRVLPLVLLTMLGVFLLSKVIRRVSINLDYQAYLEEELDKSLGELSRERSESRSAAS